MDQPAGGYKLCACRESGPWQLFSIAFLFVKRQTIDSNTDTEMEEYLLLLTGLLAGLLLGVPLGIGVSGHRHSVSGIEIKMKSRLARLAARSPKSYSICGRIAFAAVMLVWLVVFFAALVAPALLARFLGIPDSSLLVGQALRVEYFFAIVGVLAGYFFWTRMAYER